VDEILLFIVAMDDLFQDLFSDIVSSSAECAEDGASPSSSFLLPEVPHSDSTSKDSFFSPVFPDFDACLNDFVRNSSQMDLVTSSDTSAVDLLTPEDSAFLHKFIDESVVTSTGDSSSVCGLRRCSFIAPDWDAMVRHRQQDHSQRTVSKNGYPCSICDLVFTQKFNRDRHFRYRHSRKHFYCPDCLTWAPLRRSDTYMRHRKTRHGESDSSVTPHLNSPPSGYQRLKSGKKEDCNRLRFVSYVV
jgi:hypothetical protein